MRRMTMKVTHGILLTGALLLAACSQAPEGDETQAEGESLSPEAVAATERLLLEIDAGEDAVVLALGPVAPGTTLSEPALVDPADVPEGTWNPPAELVVPDGGGEYYLFLVDHEPDLMFGHHLQYAWVDRTSGAVEVADARFPPNLDRPDVPAPATPFSLKGQGKVGGNHVFEVQGDGAATLPDTGHKPTLDLPPDGELPPGIHDKADTIEAAAGTGSCLRRAMVADFGNPQPPFSLNDAFSWLEVALQTDMTENADGMGEWLGGYGYGVMRFSQTPSSPHPSLTRERLLLWLDKHAAFFSQPPPDGCCHEFFLHITSHGIEMGGMMLAAEDGSYSMSSVFLVEIYEHLARFPKGVKITFFLDSCYAGMMNPDSVPENDHYRKCADKLKPYFDELKEGRCGLTLLAASQSNKGAHADMHAKDSATADFLEHDVDVDGDGVTGDIQDRWARVKEEEFGGVEPQKWIFPENAQHWCSTDVKPGTWAQANPWCGDEKVSGAEECDLSSGSDANCSEDQVCHEGCVCEPLVGPSPCEGKECGPDGVGGSCGECEPPDSCGDDGQCACGPDCEGKDCGPDGCGGACGDCGDGEMCEDGACVCDPACGDKVCGPDACSGSCGTCADELPCHEGQCLTVPALVLEICGDLASCLDEFECDDSVDETFAEACGIVCSEDLPECLQAWELSSCVDNMEYLFQTIVSALELCAATPDPCGNGVIDTWILEECDGETLYTTDCAEVLPSTTGVVSCTDECSLDLSDCAEETVELTCPELLDCISPCVTQDCFYGCLNQGSYQSQVQVENLLMCLDAECQPPTPECYAEVQQPGGLCFEDLSDCLGIVPPGDEDCAGILECMDLCQDPPCAEECGLLGTVEAQLLYEEVLQCIIDECEFPFEDDCTNEVSAPGGPCFGALDACSPQGNPTCEGIHECALACPPGDSGCLVACNDAGDAEAQELFNPLLDCLFAECGGYADPNCVSSEIAVGGTCGDAYLVCTGCLPDCVDKDCGGDGCGGICGACAPGAGCTEGICGLCGDLTGTWVSYGLRQFTDTCWGGTYDDGLVFLGFEIGPGEPYSVSFLGSEPGAPNVFSLSTCLWDEIDCSMQCTCDSSCLLDYYAAYEAWTGDSSIVTAGQWVVDFSLVDGHLFVHYDQQEWSAWGTCHRTIDTLEAGAEGGCGSCEPSLSAQGQSSCLNTHVCWAYTDFPESSFCTAFCPTGDECEPGWTCTDYVCTPPAGELICIGDDVWYLDECGQEVGPVENCMGGCVDGACL